MTLIMPTVESDNASLSYMDRAGEGMPILFLHGSGFSKEVFSQQFESEELAGHRLIAVDLPGHGASPDAADPKATYSYAGFAAAVTGFIREIGLERCVVVGWSLGGHVAYEMLDAVPEVAGVLTFGAPPAVGGPLGIVRSLHISRNLLLISKGRFSKLDAERFELACLGGMRRGEFVDALLRTDEKMRPLLSRSVMSISGGGQKERLEASRTPVCILQGRHDPIARTGYVQTLSWPALFEGRAVIFEESGHAPFVDAQERFDRLVRRFCDAVASGQTGHAGNDMLPLSLAV
ncbi:alpha/beta fold hydrolase [Hoeflea prorocentri]|uniref:Alpha/beta hydrolase n=1 Tax=Hoeflea prorocentri TaxID=1922333 RepID=A0A9X3UD44_9HYPH|nr:alpha/beta hydrolase [Hoeflea prorocentri]MCY6379202.1 alpha/beta hydrolase [Hoeflea prorocentri]MDA5397003.1 alpha/beta hydrolase [Hoeflea prorocentri]